MDVKLELDCVVCRIHGEPFRAKWPKGYTGFALEAFKEVAATGVFKDMSEFKINKILRIKPLCCRLDKAKLVELLSNTTISVMANCSRCCQVKPGAPFKYNDPRGYGVLELRHLCFDCVVNRMVSAGVDN